MRFLLAPLEIPKLANAQPSNFGPLPFIIYYFGTTNVALTLCDASEAKGATAYSNLDLSNAP